MADDAVNDVEVDVHVLHLTMDDGGACGCGETFAGSYTDVVKAWHAHAVTITILEEVQRSARLEQAHRSATEHGIRKLTESGMSAPMISKAIGTDSEGRDLYSRSTILRLSQDKFERSPRRRHQPRG